MAENTVQSFDLGNLLKNPGLLKNATHRVPFLYDKDGKPFAGAIIVGKNSDQYQDASVALRVGNMQKAAQREAPVDTKTEEGAELLVKTIQQSEHHIAVAVTVGLYGFVVDGEPVEATSEILKTLYESCPQWQKLVTDALEVDANFSKV
jgi:hypothetical protein